MIDFQTLDLASKEQIDRCLMHCGERGCEYNFANLFLWGRQKAALHEGNLAFFCQFNRRSVYLFPIGAGDPKAAIDTIIEDAATRGIPCRLTGLLQEDCALLEQLYPGRFRYHFDRDSFDYVYDINDLADLKGRKFQKKRNHLNRFRQNNPETRLEPVTEENVPVVREFVKKWYEIRLAENPHADYLMEQAAIEKALRHWRELSMEGLLLRDGQTTLAFAMGSLLSSDTFDIHFEKAREDVDGAYNAVNAEFARYLRLKYPDVCYLNREDDVGLEGLHKAKLSYHPDHMVEKHWAYLTEEIYED